MMAMFLIIQKPNVNTLLCKGFNFIICNHVLNTSKTQGAYSPKLNLHNTCTCHTTLINPFVPPTPNLHGICIWDPCMTFLNGKIWHLTHNHATTPHVFMGAITIKQAKRHIEWPPKLYKIYNFVRYIFVVPL
jgi:hypothetical protein